MQPRAMETIDTLKAEKVGESDTPTSLSAGSDGLDGCLSMFAELAVVYRAINPDEPSEVSDPSIPLQTGWRRLSTDTHNQSAAEVSDTLCGIFRRRRKTEWRLE